MGRTDAADIASIKVKVVANFAWQHLRAACTFRDHVISLETINAGRPLGPFFQDIRTYSSGCLASCVSSLEALANELYLAHNSRLRKQIADFEAKFWGTPNTRGIEAMSILSKYQNALRLLGAPQMHANSPVFRRTQVVIALRNALIHYKPTWDSERQKTIDLVAALRGQFALSPFVDAKADFVSERCMSAGCVAWAVDVVFAFLREFDGRTILDSGKMAGFWKLEK